MSQGLFGRRLMQLLTAAMLIASPLRGDSTEVAGGQPIVVAGPATWNQNYPAYYSPSSVWSLDYSHIYLYYQGVGDPSYPRDHVYFAQKQYTQWSDLTTSFPLPAADPDGGAITILPNLVDQSADYFYGEQSVFVDAQQFFMTAAKTPNTAYFLEQLIGSSANGSAWTWQTLIKAPGAVSDLWIDIPRISLQYAAINGSSYWWGYLSYRGYYNNTMLDEAFTPIRVPLDTHTGSTATYHTVQLLDSNYVWQTYPVGSTLPSTFYPARATAGSHHRLKLRNGGYELWSSTNTNTLNVNCFGCAQQAPPYFYAVIQYSTVSPSDPLNPGATQLVQSSGVRCMPGKYTASRDYPDPVDYTPLLYSAANDDYAQSCGIPGNPYLNERIVVTQLQ